MGRRPCAVIPPAASGPALARLAAAGAACGVELSGVEPAGEGGRDVAGVRRLARRLAGRGLAPAAGAPIADCAILYSAEADLWSGGRHRTAVVRAGEALAALHVQAPVVTRVADAPPGAVLVLADAAPLLSSEAKEVRRRVEAGGAALAFGEAAAGDELGRAAAPLFPSARASGTTRVGEGLLALLPPLAPEERGTGAPAGPALERALAALLGRGRRATGVAARVPILAVLYRADGAVLAHLVAPPGERVQGATLFLGSDVAGGARRARFVAADGSDVRIPMNPSGVSVSTVLPAFRGYAVLSLAP
jgi:hypothetical protein